MQVNIKFEQCESEIAAPCNNCNNENYWEHSLVIGTRRLSMDCNSKSRVEAGSINSLKYFVFGYISDDYDDNFESALQQSLSAVQCEAIKRINGNFLLLVVDIVNARIFISGDVCGAIPLYWHKDNEGFFASTSVSAAVGALGHRELDEENFFRAITSITLVPNRSLVKGVGSLHGLSALYIDIDSSGVQEHLCSTTNERLFLGPNSGCAVDERNNDLTENLLKSARNITKQGSVLTQLSSGLDSANILGAVLNTTDYENSVVYTGLFSGTEVEDQSVIEDWVAAIPCEVKFMSDENVVQTLVDSFERFTSAESIQYPVNSHTTFPAVRKKLNTDKRYVILTGEGGDELFALGPHVLFSLLFTGKLRDIRLFSQIKKKICSTYDYTEAQIKSMLGCKSFFKTRGRLYQKFRNTFLTKRKFPGLACDLQKRFSSYYLDYEPEKNIWFPWEYKNHSLLNNLQVIQSSFWLEKEFERAEQNGFDIYHPLLEYSNIALTFNANSEDLWRNGIRKSPLRASLKKLLPDFNYRSTYKGSHFEYYESMLRGVDKSLRSYSEWETVKQGYLDADYLLNHYDELKMNGYKFHILPFEMFLRSFR